MYLKRTIKRIAIKGMILMLTLPQPGLIFAQEVIPTPDATPTVSVMPIEEVTPTIAVTEESTPTPGEEITPTPTIDSSQIVVNESDNSLENQSGIVVNDSEVEEETSSSSQSDSGNNTSTAEDGQVTIETGQAASYANVINLINTNLTNSNLKILIVNNFEGEIESLDLNKIWQEAKSNPNESFVESQGKILIISNHNLAKVSNKVEVIANSGNNQAESSGEVLIVSGNSVAIANVINLVNVNLVEAKLFLGIVNIDGNNFGDLVLPNPDYKTGSPTTISPVYTNISNNAEINDNLNTNAQSGNNNENNNKVGFIQSGDAIAGTNSFTAANENLLNENETLLVVNILGKSEGNVYNRLYPGSIESMEGLNQIVYYRNDGSSQGQVIGLIYHADNNAIVDNDIDVISNSGGNSIEGSIEGYIQSGNAIAWANLANLVNINMLGGERFYSFINIFGNWKGNIIFAYPDLAVDIDGDRNEVMAGDEMDYIVKFYNQGYEDAKGAVLEINLPQSMVYMRDSSQIRPVVEGNKISWRFDKISSREQKDIVIRVKTNGNYESAAAENNNLIKEAWAAEDYKSRAFRVLAEVAAGQNESDANNNHSEADTKLLYPTSSDKAKVNARLEIGVKNNVNDYVNPNDVVSFEVNINNNGESDIQKAELFHNIYTEDGYLWSVDVIYLGDIRMGQTGKVNFGIPMTDAGGTYTSVTQIRGRDKDDNEVLSNESESMFMVRGKLILKASRPVEASENKVLGVSSQMSPATSKSNNLFLYLLLMGSSGSFLSFELAKKLRLLRLS